MDLTNLKYFSAVADAGSFSRAAISLNMAQPSISRAVKLLEEEFGQRLLERNGRGVRLTGDTQPLILLALKRDT